MSAELLRRAAEKLREHVAALVSPVSPWKVVYFGDRGYPQRVTDDRATVIAETFEGRDSSSPVRLLAGAPEYIALMHPPVALALAEWLETYAWLRDQGADVPMHGASKVARAILREEP